MYIKKIINSYKHNEKKSSELMRNKNNLNSNKEHITKEKEKIIKKEIKK